MVLSLFVVLLYEYPVHVIQREAVWVQYIHYIHSLHCMFLYNMYIILYIFLTT